MKRITIGVHNPFQKLWLILLDSCVIALAFFIASYLRLETTPEYLSYEYLGLNLIIVFCLFLGNAYSSPNTGAPPKLPLNTMFVVVASTIPCSLFIYVAGPERLSSLFGRGIFPVAIAIISVLTVLIRAVSNRILKSGTGTKAVLMLSSKDAFDRAIEYTNSSPNNFALYRIVKNKTTFTGFDAIVISPDYKLSDIEKRILVDVRVQGTPVFSLAEFYESFFFLVPVTLIDDQWFLRAEGFSMLHRSVSVRIKRLTDIALAVLLLTISLPISSLIVFAIKLGSEGAVFYSQMRVGLRGKPFTLYKFRTMFSGAEDSGARWAEENDPRITPFGRFLRRTRIDELPQCINVLRGEMSFIGPRPERPEFTKELSKEIPYYDLRHVVKPGLTGWAQVRYSYGASKTDALHKLQYDLYYIKNYSALLDLNILMRTILVSFSQSGR